MSSPGGLTPARRKNMVAVVAGATTLLVSFFALASLGAFGLLAALGLATVAVKIMRSPRDWSRWTGFVLMSLAVLGMVWGIAWTLGWAIGDMDLAPGLVVLFLSVTGAVLTARSGARSDRLLTVPAVLIAGLIALAWIATAMWVAIGMSID